MQWFIKCIRCYYKVSHIVNIAYNASQAWYAPLTISLDESYPYAFHHYVSEFPQKIIEESTGLKTHFNNSFTVFQLGNVKFCI